MGTKTFEPFCLEDEIRDTMRETVACLEAKGYRCDVMLIWPCEAENPLVTMRWCLPGQALYDEKAKRHDLRGARIRDAVKGMAAYARTIPSVEESKRARFLESLGRVIDEGRAIGIEAGFMNPLVETMRQLSENIITDQSGGPAA